jgi:hypothetical protein
MAIPVATLGIKMCHSPTFYFLTDYSRSVAYCLQVFNTPSLMKLLFSVND